VSEPWVILDTRYGGGSRNPTESQLSNAIAELYHENIPNMLESDYAEHGSASLRLGYDDGPMFVIEVDRLRNVKLEEWADQDYELAIAPERKMSEVTEEQALQLLTWLAHGHIDRVRSQPWDTRESGDEIDQSNEQR
jgi:hypothetical protein